MEANKNSRFDGPCEMVKQEGGTSTNPHVDICQLQTDSKFVTYVTKTLVNLNTYSRKPGNYNGTITFEIDIMKKSSPLNLKFTFFAAVKTKITLLFSVTLTLCSAENS